MGRTKLSPKRIFETKRMNIGRVLIFCEGKTEKYYYDYFADIIMRNKYNDIEVFLVTAEGNAQTVLNCANKFMASEENNRKYSNYVKYLSFDCDDPPEIQPIINKASNYELLISNLLFEIWLLMHFEEVEAKISKRQIYKRLKMYLHDDYRKGHKGKIREIIQNGNIEKAIDNATKIEQRYVRENKNICVDVKVMNPYTSVHHLVEQFMI